MLESDDYNKMSKAMLIDLTQQLMKSLDAMSQALDEKSKALDEALHRETIYKETIASLNLQIYGASTERRTSVPPSLPDDTFNDAEVLADPSAPEGSVEDLTRQRKPRKKEKGKRAKDLEGLPVEEVIHDIRIDQHDCQKCGSTLRLIGKDIRDELVYVPAKTFVRRHITYVYACDDCEEKGEKATVIKADSPKSVIPYSGLASASLIANIIFRKFFMGLPLYRQEKEFRLYGIPISRQNMANWMIFTAVRYLKPLFDLMHEDLKKVHIIHCDETTVKVLKEPSRSGKRSKNSKSYFWLFSTGRSEPHPIILFKYSPSRAHDVPQQFLQGFHSYAHIDGYEAYHCIDGIIWVGCWAHLRRKLMDAFKLIPVKDRNKEPLTLCEVGLQYVDQLFEIERKIKDLSDKKIHEVRQTKSLPIMNDFFSWARANLDSVANKSKIGIALTYAVNQEVYLRRFLLDARLEISNNRGERAIVPVAIGRNNWLFCDTANGAEASAILYSFVQTAVANSLDPCLYFETVIDELAQLPPVKLLSPDILRQYLPYNDYIITKCKSDRPAPKNTNAP